MTISGLALLALGCWFALNMGASGLAPAFGPSIGARVVSARVAAVVYGVFVTVGALLLGPNVAKTLSSGLVPASHFDMTTTLCVLGAANIALLIANLLAVPQSTSWVTVASIMMVGVFDNVLVARTFTHRMLPAWLLLPLVAFFATAALTHLAYPLRGTRFSVHAWLSQQRGWLRALAFASSCYVALAIGANNVANAVGPLNAAGLLDVRTGLLVIAPVFGIGAFMLGGPARMMARDLVPLGLLAAIVCNVVVATLLLVASYMGIPQSLVQLGAGAVLGVALVKEGRDGMLDGRGTRRMLVLWVVSPVFASALCLIGMAVLR